MKKNISIVFLIIEIVCIFVAFYISYKRKADHWYTPILIPDNMQLTLTDDVCFQILGGDTYTVPRGTTCIPIQINYDSVTFYYDEVTDIKYTVNWDNIYEKDQLMELRVVAENHNNEVRTSYKLRGLVLGILFGVLWFIVETILTRIFLNKESKLPIVFMHIIALVCVFSFLYLSGSLFFEH